MKVIVSVIILLSALFPVASVAEEGTALLGLLKAGNYEELETATVELQSKFEKGELSEIELRNAYRQFYHLDREDLINLEEWRKRYPDSYSAHLANGIFLKRMGFDIRGVKSISETPQDKIDLMNQYLDKAEAELLGSLKLTKKPILSIFHLLSIYMQRGDKKTALALLESANIMLPDNTLIRNRYLNSLRPRWGGSYGEMKDFLEKSRAEGVNDVGIMQLEAIMYDDMGDTMYRRGHKNEALEHFSKAQELGQRVGKEFTKEWLGYSNYYSCLEPALKEYCQ